MEDMSETEGRPHLRTRSPSPEELVGLLADPLRRRLIALLDEGDRTIDDVLSMTGASPREVLEQLARLENAHVVVRNGGTCHLDGEIFGRSVQDAATERLGPLNDKHTQLARRFFYRNRLVEMPSETWAVQVVLDLVVEDFQVGEGYTEREVNSTLFGWYNDWALLRRLLVDRGYLTRDAGIYRRVEERHRH